MQERDNNIAPRGTEAKENPQRGELYFLGHPGTSDIFSGYGLVVEDGSAGHLLGILMVDRPRPADPRWLEEVETTFGECQLVPMTARGDRGVVCQMQIEPCNLSFLRRVPGFQAEAIKSALEPLLADPPKPIFSLHWDAEMRLWCSRFGSSAELPGEIREVFERTGYGCLTAETDVGVVHVCHAADQDIDGFVDQPVSSQWQLIEMPTAPLIRLEMIIFDRPDSPYLFESFLNVAEKDQAYILDELTRQHQLHLAFFGDELEYRFTKSIEHDDEQRHQLRQLVLEAIAHWAAIPADQRDFDSAKAKFMQRTVLSSSESLVRRRPG